MQETLTVLQQNVMIKVLIPVISCWIFLLLGFSHLFYTFIYFSITFPFHVLLFWFRIKAFPPCLSSSYSSFIFIPFSFLLLLLLLQRVNGSKTLSNSFFFSKPTFCYNKLLFLLPPIVSSSFFLFLLLSPSLSERMEGWRLGAFAAQPGLQQQLHVKLASPHSLQCNFSLLRRKRVICL